MDRRFTHIVFAGLVVICFARGELAAAEDVDTYTADQSMVTLERRLGELVRTEGRYSPPVIETLIELGRLSTRAQHNQDGLEYFKRAQHAMHRNEGVYTLSQIPLIDLMTRASLVSGNVQLVDELLQFKHRIYRKNFGQQHVKTVPSLVELGNWYQARALYGEAELRYEKAIDILSNDHKAQDWLAMSLRSLAFNQYLQGRCCDPVLVDQLTDTAIGADQISAIVEIADMSLLQSQPDLAVRLYRVAWNEDKQLINEIMDRPVLLGVSRIDRMVRAYHSVLAVSLQHRMKHDRFRLVSDPAVPPGQLLGSPLPVCEARLRELTSEDYRDYRVDLRLTVTPEGQPVQVRIVSSNAPGGVNQLLERVISVSRFRPQMVNGKPVRHTMDIHQTFRETVDVQVKTDSVREDNLAVFHGCHLLAASR